MERCRFSTHRHARISYYIYIYFIPQKKEAKKMKDISLLTNDESNDPIKHRILTLKMFTLERAFLKQGFNEEER